MLRLGCGAGFSSDRLGPAVDLARDGDLDWLVFETIGERTMAFGHRDRLADPSRGYNPQLAQRMRGVLAHASRRGTRIVTNMGVANVQAAAEVTGRIARELGLAGLTVAAVEGDDVTHLMTPDTPLFDFANRTIAEVGRPMVGANVYLGIDAILPGIASGADVVITGRVADPSLFLAPLVHHYGWASDDWAALGRGTLVGHLMECGMQITGGYFADPGIKDVPRLADCGYPIAEVATDGTATITKLVAAGGVVSARTVKEQLLYEVHDPAAYLTPDVVADFSGVSVTEIGPNRVAVAGANGHRRPETLKVTVGFDGGYLGEAGVSYAGRNALARARLARDVLAERLALVPGLEGGVRIDLVGVDSVHATAGRPDTAEASAPAYDEDAIRDVRVRVAARVIDREAVETLIWEVESLLCCGPAGGGGFRGRITPSVVTHSCLVVRDLVQPTLRMLRA